MEPILYGDTVGLSHPGTNARIVKDKGKEYIQFKVIGGKEGTRVENGATVIFEQEPGGNYSVLSSEDQWKIKIDGEGGLHSGAKITLVSIPENKREPQLYIIFKIAGDPIEHVVLLMLENRSFFRVYGYMDPNRDNYVNYSNSGKEFRSGPTNDLETPDPPHEISFVTAAIVNEKPDGFVKAYEDYHKVVGDVINDDDLKDVMGYTQKGFLPALHKMEEFASICSQWYCSIRGPTWPNRMFALSGTSFGWRTTPEMSSTIVNDLQEYLGGWYGHKPVHPQRFSVFDVLEQAKASYKIYTDAPFEFSLAGDVFYPAVHDDDMDEFRKDAKDGTLPKFSFIEPNYINMPSLGFVQNDDHPPSNPLDAQKFIAEVYNTLRNGRNWEKTLLVVTYDEHGGFFDPKIPPKAPIPDAISTDDDHTFGYFGFRVPTVLVSPCIKHGIDDTVYDHTSVLKYVLQKWAPEGVNQLGERVKHANTLPVLSTPRTDVFPLITEEDFRPLKELRAANNKEVETPTPGYKLKPRESAAEAIKDPEIEQAIRRHIITQRLSQDTKQADVYATIAAQVLEAENAKKAAEAEKAEKAKHEKEGFVEHALHEIQEAGSAIASAISDLFASHPQGPTHISPTHAANATSATHATSATSATHATSASASATHATISAPALSHPVTPVAAIASAVVKEAAREDAEQYADFIIQQIKHGVSSLDEPNAQKGHDILAYQIRATGMFAKKHAGTNDLAKSYLNLMQAAASKHATKLATKKPKRV